ncbi:MAG TPA: hypothetical protein VNU48_06820 [Burkholderiaceae bacterium]|nr:hypothetical protein [Burkholderiaceae bacterium]
MRPAHLLVVGTALLLCTQVHAMQRCRIDGRLVYQASPCPEATQVAPRSAELPHTLAAVDADVPVKRTMAEVMREREAAIRARPTASDSRPDGAKILRDRMGAL